MSSVYGGAMVDPLRDPALGLGRAAVAGLSSDVETWADGENWQLGHWLNGRLGGTGVDGLARAILTDFGITGVDVRK